ncbi:NRDE family protein [Streptomyces gardneri]|uniref:NRDE family protein n=1 Tax=Nocardia TaxID=1817 RepID=UPI00135C96DD|nr:MULTISPECIES: NRDE family protein [Nocardia]MBF6164098.1 NRDE family protein [Streptomyces gardneri]MBF6203673.1 NRDE family protein [Streptomyces gardneri]
MCLVLIGWRAHPDYRLIVAANREEFYTRPTESMRWWPEAPGLLAGRDTGATGRTEGEPPGTWLGLSTQPHGNNRFAAVTNVRDPADQRVDARSRGALLLDFLRGAADRGRAGEFPGPEKYVLDVAAAPDDYNGYNLLVSDLRTLWWHSNRSATEPRELTPGFHGLSNGTFVTSAGPTLGEANLTAPQPIWPKVRAGVTELREIVGTEPGAVDRYFEVLADRTEAPDDRLPRTGVPYEMERALSARFVAHTVHGTRASTVLVVREDGTFEMVERSFGRLGEELGEVVVRGLLDLTG